MTEAPALRDSAWFRHGGLALTLLGVLATEAALHGLDLPRILATALLLLTLAAVAYAGLRGGFLQGALAAAMLALYTVHFTSPEGSFAALTVETVQGSVVMLLLGLGMAMPMALIKRREDAMRGTLQERAEALEARNRELSEANAALEAFGYVVSHDLKEPVRAIENYLEAAEEEYDTPDGREFLEKARDANRRLTRLLQGLLAYSRASSTLVSPEPLDVAAVLRSEACRAHYEAAARERDARLDVAPGLPPVQADPFVLAQLLGNLVLNAVRHNPRDRPLVRVFAAEAPPGRVHLVVEDDGAGFPPDVLARFAELRGARPSTLKGGFGLVISHRAAQRVGARMWLENLPGGGGARVHLELPEADGAPQAEAKARTLPAA